MVLRAPRIWRAGRSDARARRSTLTKGTTFWLRPEHNAELVTLASFKGDRGSAVRKQQGQPPRRRLAFFFERIHLLAGAGQSEKLLVPIQDHIDIRFRGVLAALDDDKAFAVRGECVVGAGGFVPDLTLIEHMSFSYTEGRRAGHVDGPQRVRTLIDESSSVTWPSRVSATVGRN